MRTPNRKQRLLSTVAAAATMLAAGGALGSVLAPVTLESLAKRADLIVRGRAESVTSAWTGDHKHIRTVTRLTVASAIKGEPPTTLEIVTPGGVVGDVAQKVHGAAQFTPGEEVIVLLEKLPAQPRFAVAGLALGKFSVVEDEQGERTVVQNRVGLAMPESDGRVAPVPPFEPMREASFIQFLQSAVRAGAQP